ncbi:uncharacterized protein LOC143833921 isoform X2 [Paroedura picta]|uniref:uncharacterized protein LOC143833921 isoform X2 n=1 Tax=Paroedura picta TaxID=143630 RepID=UPI004056725A
MATGHGGGSAQHAHSDGEQEPGAKRLKMDPACHVAQAGGLEKVGEGLPLEGVKQEPGEEPWQGAEAQRQPFPKVVEIFSSERGSSGDQGRAGGLQPPLEATPEPRGYKIPLLLSGSAQKPQSPPVGQGKTVYKIVKAGFTGEVGREEVILGDDLSSWDAERRRFRDFCYYEAVGPRLTSVRLWTLCRQWLRPEKRTKEQILEQVILEQFLAILPPEMQSWVKAHHPNSCPRAVALAEGFLLIQEQKAQEALQKEAAGIPKTEEPPLESCQRPFASMEIKQENDGDPKPGAGTLPVVKEEDLSQEDPLMEPPATAAGRAQGSVPSPREPKEEPGTTCNPGDGIGRKIKEEDLSEEESPMEVAASAEEGPQQNVSFPSGSALVGLPEEEPGATWNPGDGTVSEIKVEVLSEEDALAEEPETAAGGAQPSSAFPSGSSTVRLPKEPGTACNPGDGTVKEIKEEVVSEEEAAAPAGGIAQRSVAFPSGSALATLSKEEPGTTCSPGSLSSALCKPPAATSEEPPGKSGEPDAQGLALGREEEVAGEREEVWTGYGKTFRWKSVLTPCKEAATDWKIYQCCACGKSCDARSIRAHQKLHTGERLYECIYCGRTFSQRSHFESHEKIHTGVKVQTSENLYICVTCGKSFAYYSTLVAHKRSHGEDDASMTG